MSAVAFDTLKFATKLEQRGFTHEQAAGASDALAEALGGLELATKEDLKAEAAAIRTDLKAEIKSSAADTKIDILRWLVVTQIALAGFIFAAIRFSH